MKLRLALGAAMVALVFFAGPARAEGAPATPPAESASQGSAPPTTAAASTRTVWPWILMGTGVALIATATVLEINAVGQDNKRESEEVKLTALPTGDPERKRLQASADEHADSASSGRTAGLIVGTVGFLTVAGSVVLWFVEGSKTASTPAVAKPTFTPSLSPTYAGASFGVSF